MHVCLFTWTCVTYILTYNRLPWGTHAQKSVYKSIPTYFNCLYGQLKQDILKNLGSFHS